MNRSVWLLAIAVLCIGVGRGWEHIFFDAPYREFLWDESMMTPIVKAFLGISWSEFATDPVYDELFQKWFKRIGLMYFLLAFGMVISAFFYKKAPTSMKIFNGLAAFILTFLLLLLALLLFKKQFYHTGQLLEHALQVSTPFFLYSYLTCGWTKKLENAIKIAIALTFGCHGLYAIGYYPVPGEFVEMTINILKTGDDSAKLFLKIVGLLDLIMSILIFFPGKWRKFALIYIIVWGFLTAIARIWGHWHTGYEIETLNKYWFQVLYRLPHGLVPLVLLHFFKKT